MSKSVDTPSFYGYFARSASYAHCLVFFSLGINKDSESLLSLLYRWNSTTHTFFVWCQEVSPSLENVYEMLKFPLFGDGEVTKISLSLDEAKAIEFLEDAV